MMWIFFSVAALALFGVCIWFLLARIVQFGFVKAVGGERKWLCYIFAAGLLFVPAVILGWCLGGINAMVVFMHLTLFWAIFYIVGRGRKWVAPSALGFTLVYLLWGAWNAYHVVPTYYKFQSDKVSSPIRIAMISDSHLGTLFSGKKLGQYMRIIEEEKPDALVVVGDFVDDSTSLSDMKDGARALKGFKAPYGVYFVFGNHDKGYSAGRRGYGYKEVKAALLENEVHVLEDDVAFLGEQVAIIGRNDLSDNMRGSDMGGGTVKTIDDMISSTQLTPEHYSIVLDHQPYDYKNLAGKADLVLSGHTHGGQLIPIRRVGELMGVNDMTYGHKNIGGTDFIVSSGIADWAICFKTGCKAEYVIIDIE